MCATRERRCYQRPSCLICNAHPEAPRNCLRIAHEVRADIELLETPAHFRRLVLQASCATKCTAINLRCAPTIRDRSRHAAASEFFTQHWLGTAKHAKMISAESTAAHTHQRPHCSSAHASFQQLAILRMHAYNATCTVMGRPDSCAEHAVDASVLPSHDDHRRMTVRTDYFVVITVKVSLGPYA